MYHFEQCAPQDVIYQLDYNKEGLAQKEEYLQMFNDCGWEHLQDHAGYSYFRKPVSDGKTADEIFCDDESRMQMMERVIKGRMLPLLIIFLAVLLPQFNINLFNSHDYLLVALYGGILVVYITVFLMCAVKYIKLKSRIKK